MDPFLGEVRLLGNSYAPKGWALCDGSKLDIRSATALFAILGVTYGGDGITTFNLPDLRDRVPVGPGQLAGGAYYQLGETGGTPEVTVTIDSLPSHNHTWSAGRQPADSSTPGPAVVLSRASDAAYQPEPFVDVTTMDPTAVARWGDSGPHPNMQPYLVLNYYIALQGIWPQRP